MSSSIEAKILEILEKKGTAVGNITMRELLDIEQECYREAISNLVKDGKVKRGMGRGGSVSLINITLSRDINEQSEEILKKEIAEEEKQYRDEMAMYGVIEKELKLNWTEIGDYKYKIVEKTALQGRRMTGGKWSRPDFVIVGYRSFKYLPESYLDIITIEVKPQIFDITAVYEALAHRRSATQSYVWLHCPSSIDRDSDVLNHIRAEAANHGIGLILAEDPGDSNTWATQISADRIMPDPKRLNETIGALSEESKHEIEKWFEREINVTIKK